MEVLNLVRVLLTLLAVLPLLLPKGTCVCAWASGSETGTSTEAAADESRQGARCCGHHHDEQDDDSLPAAPQSDGDSSSTPHHCSFCVAAAKRDGVAVELRQVEIDLTLLPMHFESVVAPPGPGSSARNHGQSLWEAPPIYLCCCALLI